jgi:hypothetical protein
VLLPEGGYEVTHPTVVAVCLTADRPEMTRQAVERFRAQTYTNKRLLILDSGSTSFDPDWDMRMRQKPLKTEVFGNQEINIPYTPYGPFVSMVRLWMEIPLTIGELRNLAITQAGNVFSAHLGGDIICHWDSDDWSHANRIAEQVALLQSSGAECVGYNEMLFWDERSRHGTCIPSSYGKHPKDKWACQGADRTWWSCSMPCGEAWLYSGGTPALGTSLAYWRKTWERRPFPSLMTGEDASWLTGVNVVGVSSLPNRSQAGLPHGHPGAIDDAPRMVARIHGGNTSRSYDPGVMAACERQGDVWKRVPNFDGYCRSIFQ